VTLPPGLPVEQPAAITSSGSTITIGARRRTSAQFIAVRRR
jgi:hypothetical protein